MAFHDADGGIDVLRVWRMLRHDVKGQCFADLGQDWILWGRVIVIDQERTFILGGRSPFPVHMQVHFPP